MARQVLGKLACFRSLSGGENRSWGRFRRISFRSLSLNGVPSFKGVTPLPLSGPISMEDMKYGLENLNELINHMSGTGNESRRRELMARIEDCVKSNFPQLGQILDKCGGGANGQKPATAGDANGNELHREICKFLQGLGHLHWVGAVFTIVAMFLDRWWKASKYDDDLLKVMKNLRDIGNHVLEVHVHVQVSQDSKSRDTLDKAVRIICEYATCCDQAAEGKSFGNRFVFADSSKEKLDMWQKEITELYPQLVLTGITEMHRKLNNMRYELPSETFEITDSTAMVGNKTRVEEASKKLKDHDGEEGVRALTLVGFRGMGKTPVGQGVAAELMQKKSFGDLKLHCATIVMRGDNEEEIRVTDKQKELYWKLRRDRAKPVVFDSASGQRQLAQLFEDMKLRDEPVLLLFVGVHSGEDLDSVLPNKLDTLLHPKSVLLVTTANHDVTNVLDRKGVISISCEVQELEKEEAKELLLRKIFGDCDFSRSSPLARELMQSKDFRQLLDFCGGVPLTINVVGSTVWSKGRDYLRSCFNGASLHKKSFDNVYGELDLRRRKLFLDKLRKSMSHAYMTLSDGDPINDERCHLNRSLEYAYKELKSRRILELFLDIVAVHLGHSWEEVELAAADRACGAVGLATLKQLSMIKRLVYKDGTSIVQVHSLLVGLSRRMENSESRGRRLVVSNTDELPECTAGLELLKVDHSEEPISATRFDGLTSTLRYLELYGTKIKGKCKKIPQNLTFLKCRRSSLPFFPLDGLRKVVVLYLDLEMDDTLNLECVQSMPNIEWLTLKNSTRLKRIGPKLPRLTTVKIESCPNFASLEMNPAADPGLNSVKHVEIVNSPRFDCSALVWLVCLERLCLAGFEFTSFPKTLEFPSGVRIVDLSRNGNLRELPKFAAVNRVKKLNLRCNRALREFSGEMIHFSSLEHLDLGGCEGLERLSFLPEHLPMLQILDVEGCAKVPRSELCEMKEQIEVRNPKFRMIGLKLQDESVVPGECGSCSKVSFEKSPTLPSVGKLEDQLNGSELENEDDEPGRCAAVKRCLRSSCTKSYKVVTKVPQRTLKLCCTFPLRSKDKVS